MQIDLSSNFPMKYIVKT